MSGQVVAIVSPQGAAKSLPLEDLVLVGGRSLFERTLRQALAARVVDRVVVTTDDPEIAELSLSCGAEVFHCPAESGSKDASSESVLLSALDSLGGDPDLLVILRSTSRFRSPGVIDAAVGRLRKEHADSLFSASSFHGSVWEEAGGELILADDPRERARRQETGRRWLENGSIYVCRPAVLRESGSRLSGRIAVYPMSPGESSEVDDRDDVAGIDALLSRPGAREIPDLSSVRLLVLDFDGVLTDNRVWVSQDGHESVACNRSDGLGLELLRSSGCQILVLSKERNPVVATRCRKLGLECLQGQDEKLRELQRIAAERDLDRGQIAYVGNDVNDLECMAWAGIAVAVADAEPAVLAGADWVTRRGGGRGAVREVCDRLLESREDAS